MIYQGQVSSTIFVRIYPGPPFANTITPTNGNPPGDISGVPPCQELAVGAGLSQPPHDCFHKRAKRDFSTMPIKLYVRGLSTVFILVGRVYLPGIIFV